MATPVSPRLNTEFSLFSSADDCLAPYLGRALFDESLLLNILFQERLLLHEAYFFNSTLLAEHVGRPKGHASLFELAAKRSLIIPAFRNVATTSLEEAYDSMRDTYGPSYVLLHPKMLPVRDRVVSAVTEGLEKVNAFYWPSSGSLGEGYLRVIRELLQTSEPPDYVLHNPGRALLIERVWQASVSWRFDNVDAAAELTRRKGASGLQRVDLLCSIGWSKGIPRHVMNITPQDIVERCADAEERLMMEVFLKWITQCHHLNQARQFGTAMNFPMYDLDRDFIVDSLLPTARDDQHTKSEGFQCEVLLPPIDVLATRDAKNLVAVREDLGGAYLYGLRRWQQSPSQSNQEVVVASLKAYCDQICALYEETDLQAFVARTDRGAGTSVVKSLVGLGGSVVSSIGIFSQVGGLLTNVYKYVRTVRRRRQNVVRPQQLEVVLGQR